MRKTFNDWLLLINKCDFISFYSQNTLKDTCIHFGFGRDILIKLCSFWNYKKTKKEQLNTLRTKLTLKYGSVKQSYAIRREKSKETKLLRYGDENFSNKEKAMQTSLNKYGSKYFNNREKASETCKQRYGGVGNASKELKEKQRNTMLRKYGVAHNWSSEDPKLNGSATRNERFNGNFYNYSITKGRHTKLEKYGDEHYHNIEKAQSTMRQKYGVSNFCEHNKCREKLYSNETKLKRDNTHRKNNSFNASSPENKLYNLLISKYGDDNVVRNYKCDKYPFLCDFYIKTLDKFIELNYHWTHGSHPFNKDNKLDLLKLEQWKEKSKKSLFYKNAIYVWTDLDVRKQQIAKNNGLNYLVIYNGENYEDI